MVFMYESTLDFLLSFIIIIIEDNHYDHQPSSLNPSLHQLMDCINDFSEILVVDRESRAKTATVKC